MPIFKQSAPETVRLLSGHILSRNASDFTHSHLDVKYFTGEKPPGPCLRGGGIAGIEGIKGFRHLKEREGRKRQGRARGIREGKGGEGAAAGGILLQVLRGTDAPEE